MRPLFILVQPSTPLNGILHSFFFITKAFPIYHIFCLHYEMKVNFLLLQLLCDERGNCWSVISFSGVNDFFSFFPNQIVAFKTYLYHFFFASSKSFTYVEQNIGSNCLCRHFNENMLFEYGKHIISSSVKLQVFR